MIRASIWRSLVLALLFGSLAQAGSQVAMASPVPPSYASAFIQADDDGDGIPNDIDPDDDNDGILDADEGDPNAAPANDPLPDRDGDGITDDMDPDDNNNGATDEKEPVSAPAQPAGGSSTGSAPTGSGSASSAGNGPLVRSLPVTGAGAGPGGNEASLAILIAASLATALLVSGLRVGSQKRSAFQEG